MREKDSKDERGTREVLEIFRSASPLVTFLRPSFVPFYRIIRSTELFGEFKENKNSNIQLYRIIRYSTESFGFLPNYSVPYRIIRSTELFSTPTLFSFDTRRHLTRCAEAEI